MDYYKPARPPRVNAVVQCRWDEQYGRYLPQKLETTHGWRPIAEAPRDGTWVLLTGGLPDWTDGTPYDDDPCAPASVAKWDRHGWLVTLAEGGCVGVEYNNPTHFMPLPPAPEQP